MSDKKVVTLYKLKHNYASGTDEVVALEVFEYPSQYRRMRGDTKHYEVIDKSDLRYNTDPRELIDIAIGQAQAIQERLLNDVARNDKRIAMLKELLEQQGG